MSGPALRLVEAFEAPPARPSLVDLARRRISGSHDIDPWGLDPDLVGALSPLLAARYDILVDHADRIPASGPALVVANRRFGASEAFVLARGIRLATGRHLRVVGVPDVDPLGPLLRRLGGVLARPDEVAGLLRAGEVVGVFLDRDLHPRTRAGAVPTGLVAPAFAERAPVIPAAVLGRELGRFWRVRLGERVRRPRGRGPLAVAELADRARAGVQRALDEADPPRGWI